jgi:Cu+-exporting ATPase
MATTHESASAQGVVDPVCDMTIEPADAVGHSEYKGQTYYFCSDSCLERFRATPAPFLEADGEISPAAAGPAVETDYTCPMDPEIRQTGAGACPK